MWEVLGVIFTVVIPLITFAYLKPKAFGLVKIKVTFYTFWIWLLFVQAINLASVLERAGIITINVNFDLLDIVTSASLADLTAIILTPPIIAWVIMSAFEKASKLPKE